MKQSTKTIPIFISEDGIEHLTAQSAIEHDLLRRLDAWGVGRGGEWDTKMLSEVLAEHSDSLVKVLLPLCTDPLLIPASCALDGAFAAQRATQELAGCQSALSAADAALLLKNGQTVHDLQNKMRWAMTGLQGQLTDLSSVTGVRDVVIDYYHPDAIGTAMSVHPTLLDWVDANATRYFISMPIKQVAVAEALVEMRSGWCMREGDRTHRLTPDGNGVTVSEKVSERSAVTRDVPLRDWHRDYHLAKFHRIQPMPEITVNR